jgi:hypothetical protein
MAQQEQCVCVWPAERRHRMKREIGEKDRQKPAQEIAT